MYSIRQANEPAPDIWQALADPTRRSLVDRLATGSKTTSQLCEGMPMSRFGVMKHIGVLERAGVIISRKQGRFRVNHLNVAKIHSLQSRWLSPRGAAFAGALDGLTDITGGNDMSQSDSPTSASVIDLALDWPVAVSVQKLWATLFEQPEIWWPRAYRAGSEDAVMTFDQKIGGCLREESANGGGVLWYSIFAINPRRSVDLVGDLAVRYGGPARSTLRLEVLPGETEGTSILKLTDAIVGRIGADMRNSVSGGWQAILGEGLVAHLNKQA
ncbi:helix-turn-helix domain-containing protein [Dokdonella sp.]|uniref:ArsR/SmtB family transcription factor n=1 Tax=Dokdonella sp. TaxID=2291710 RepID=UPI003528160E